MSREALLEIVHRERNEPSFREQLEADALLAVKGYELTPAERASLLRFLRGLRKESSSASKVIYPMVGRRIFLDETDPWAFAEMSLADLFELAWAAGHLSKPIPPLMKELSRRAGNGEPAKSIYSSISGADYAAMGRAIQERADTIPDLTGPDALWTSAKRDWASCLLSELEARMCAAESATAADIAESCAAVRRFLRGLVEEQDRSQP